MDFAVPTNHRVKIKDSEKIDEFFNLDRELKEKNGNMNIKVIAIVNALITVSACQGEGSRGIGNQCENQNHPDYSIAEIDENTEKNPRELTRLGITHNFQNRKSISLLNFLSYLVQ